MTEQTSARERTPAGADVAAPRLRSRGFRRWFDEGPLRRVFRNAGVLLGGKSVAGLLGLGALALTARALGPEVFGILVLVHTYVQAVTGFTRFQSWQAVIRYGASCLKDRRREDFQRLVKFTMLLDLGSALIGTVIAISAAPLAGRWLDWSDDTVRLAMLFSVVILFTMKATPTGILRLFDRFDALAIQSTVVPGVRFTGAVIAFVAGGGLAAFLVAWFAAGVIGGLVLLALGWRELARQDLTKGMNLSLKRLVKPHPGLWKFVWTVNLQTSLGLVWGHFATLVIGSVLGPVGAGLYKVASQFARVMAVPAFLLKRTIYPELAKLSAEGSLRAVRRVMLRAGLVAGSGAALAIGIVAVFGEVLIRLTVGDAYVGAYDVLLLLAFGTAVQVYGVALEPVFFAIGRPGILLRVSVVTTLLYFGLLIVLLDWIDLIGAGVAMIVGTITGVVALTAIALRCLAKPAPGKSHAADAPEADEPPATGVRKP